MNLKKKGKKGEKRRKKGKKEKNEEKNQLKINWKKSKTNKQIK